MMFEADVKLKTVTADLKSAIGTASITAWLGPIPEGKYHQTASIIAETSRQSQSLF